jgi:hypothetical protein
MSRECEAKGTMKSRVTLIVRMSILAELPLVNQPNKRGGKLLIFIVVDALFYISLFPIFASQAG